MPVRPGGLVATPDAQWEASARREPYFTVFTSPKFLRANLTAAHEREFFDTGDTFVESTFRTIAARFVPDFAPASILEYGCGVGRLAIPFARRAGSVTAVDRSPSMLDVARTHATRRAVANISFQTPSEFFGKRKKFDLVNCYLVLQRLRPSEGLALLTELVGCLGAGGIGVLQFAYRTRTSRYIEAVRHLRERVPAVNGVANLLRGNPVGQAFLPTHAYDLNDVVRTLHDASIHSHYVMFEESEGLSSAVVFVEAPPLYTSYAVVSAL